MSFKFWKNFAITVAVMGPLVWVYVLADMYLYAVSEIMNGILVVAGFIFITFIVFLIICAEPGRKDNTPPWEREYQRWRDGK